MDALQHKKEAFGRLLQIMDELRSRCPWDRKQTMESLRHLTIEEVYELGGAILDGDAEQVRRELGDLLLHVIFYAKIGEEQGQFDIAGVIHGQCEKLIHRHPHIYGDTKVQDAEEVSRNWEALKMKEGHRSVLAGVPAAMPSLVKAMRIQEKARAAGFDWEKDEQVMDKVREEFGEFEEAVAQNRSADMAGEFGDLLFSLVNLARFLGINPEESLERTNRKFIRRFAFMEDKARDQGVALASKSLAELDDWWDEAKRRGL
jgi:XTP/dITP diphosphohydrolase